LLASIPVHFFFLLLWSLYGKGAGEKWWQMLRLFTAPERRKFLGKSKQQMQLQKQ
jgi:hypothetical protein